MSGERRSSSISSKSMLQARRGSSTLITSLRIYDRKNEIDTIADAYARSHTSCEIMWLHGYAGAGKTTLARTALGSKENFFAAKFDQLSNSHQPFSALADICGKLCYIVEFECIPLSISKDDALLLGRLVPEMAHTLDIELENTEDPFCKLNFGFEKLKKAVLTFIVEACKNLSSPAIIVLDDLQWADTDSLEVIKSLLSDKQVKRLLFVGCFRDNHSDRDKETNTLSNCLQTVQKESIHRIVSIEVRNLDKSFINEMVANVLAISPSDSNELSDLIFEKTLGNPFYTLQMVRFLETKKLLFRDSDGFWEWDTESIRQQVAPSDNVLSILSTRLLSMPQDIINVLKVASCFGSEITLQLLTALFLLFHPDKGDVNVQDLLQQAGDLVSFEAGKLGFVHHRILYAVYDMIPPNKRSCMHRDIGSYLWRTISQDYGKPVENSWQFLHSVEQLNRGRDSINTEEDRVELAHRNLMAAKKVKITHAFTMAATFSETGLELLGLVRWEKQHRLALELTTILAEVRFSTGAVEECLVLVEEIYNESECQDDCIKAQSVHMDALTCASRLQDCLRIGMGFIESLGHPKLPRNPSQLQQMTAILRTKARLRGMSDRELLSLPSSRNPKMLGISRHLTQLKCVCLCANEETLIPIFISRMVDNILKYGANEWTPHAYCAWAYILTVLGDFQGAARFSRLSIKIMDRFRQDGSSLTVVAALLNHIRMPLQECIEPMSKAYDVCCSQGDIAYAGEACMMMCSTYFVAGSNLECLAKDLFEYCTVFHNFGHVLTFKALLMILRSVLMLLGRPDDIAEVAGKVLNDSRFDAFVEKSQAGMVLFLFRTFTMATRFYLGDQEAALALAEKCWKNNCLKGAMVPSVLYFTFSALTAIDAWKSSRKAKFLRHFRKSQRDLRNWVKKGNPNTAHLRSLLDTELAAVRRRSNTTTDQVRRGFDQSIALALDGGFKHDAALASERAGQYFLDQQRDLVLAGAYLQQSQSYYSSWGAVAKVQQMKEAYGYEKGLLRPSLRQEKLMEINSLCNTFTASSQALSIYSN